MDDLWRLLQARFQQWTGMSLPPTMRRAASEAVRRLARDAGCSPISFLRRLSRDTEGRQRLLDEIGLGTTWFMRDQAGLFALADALARITPRGQPVWLWSAGCSSGEEPYSLAIALAEAGMSARILATDINRKLLRQAFDGRYRAQAVERMPREWRERYFVDAGEGMARVSDSIRQWVTFELHNFRTSEELPVGWHRFDAVICRNVLIYFERADAVRVIDRLAWRCRPGGYLLLGAIERPLFWMSNVAASADLAELVQVSGDPPRGSAPLPVPVPRRKERQAPALTPPSPRAGGREARREEDITPLLSQAERAEQEGRIDAALALIDAAVVRVPLAAPAHLARGLALKRAGRVHEAIEAFRAARFLDAHAWLAPFQLALCLEAVGESQEAYEAYRHALGVLETQGPSGLVNASVAVDNLAATVAEVCRNRVRRGLGVRTS